MDIAVLLPDRFADWETALLGAVARSFLGVATRHVTRHGDPVESMAGLRVHPDASLDDPALLEVDALVVCGGEGWSTPAAPDPGPQVRSVLEAGAVVGGICDGVVALARAGVLDTVRHTANAGADLAATGYGGRAWYVDSPSAVREGLVVTAPGTAPVSFAREVLAALLPEQQPGVEDFLRLYSREHLLDVPDRSDREAG